MFSPFTHKCSYPSRCKVIALYFSVYVMAVQVDIVHSFRLSLFYEEKRSPQNVFFFNHQKKLSCRNGSSSFVG